MSSPAGRPGISGLPGTALVVEPDLNDRVFLASTLMAAGLRVTATDSFKRAESFLLARPPCVLVAEIRLGAYNGLHLALLGRSIRPHMAQLLTSEFHDDVLHRDTNTVGATFVLKPITTGQLLAALYRTMFRDPNADGTVAAARPQLDSDRGEHGRHGVRLRETVAYLRALRRPVS